MKAIVIIINGKEYPCYATMGAFRRYERISGKRHTELDPGSVTDLTDLLWACTAAACAREGVEFTHTADELADNITPDQLAQWYGAMTEGADEDSAEGEKKSPLNS